MRALTVFPGQAGSARLEAVPEPDRSVGAVLVRAVATGLCGTDAEIVQALRGEAPVGARAADRRTRVTGQVMEAPKVHVFDRSQEGSTSTSSGFQVLFSIAGNRNE